jgi:hypothetical protein
LEKLEIDSTGQSTQWHGLHVHRAIYGQAYTWRARASKKPRYFEKFKIDISIRRIQTKLPTRKRFNTRSILLTLTPAMCWGLEKDDE